jgi:predicted HicB family RNase H-like nuclease
MSLERKDIRAKVDPTVHEHLRILAEVEGIDIGEWIERELVKVISDRVHAATLIASAVARLGRTGSGRE